MTIGSTIPARVSFNCDGVSKVFPVQIQAYQASDITVVLTAPVSAGGGEATLTLNSDYSMVAAGTLSPQQWTLTTLAANAYAIGYTLQAFINPVQSQQTSYVQGQAFPSLAVQTNFDRLTQMVQRLWDRLSRAVFAPDGDVSPGMALPTAAARALMYLAFDVNGNVLPTAALPGTANTAASLGPIFNPRSPAEIAAAVFPVNYLYAVGNVLRYGADPTFVADSTAAFNNAALSNFSPITAPTAYKTVYVPGGQYKITDTVYVPTGTILHGDGMSSYIDASTGFAGGTHDVFKLGWSLVAGVPTKNTIYLTGGFPPEIYGLFVNGGPASASVVNINFPGALCHDIWFSGAGQAVYLAGGYVYNCEIDIGLTGITIGPGINQSVTNVRFFNQNVPINFDVGTGDISDCIFNGCTIEYPKVVGVQVGTGTVNIRGIKFVGCDYINNPNSLITSFSACVSVTNPNTQIEFDACTFHNWGKFGSLASAYAIIVQAAGAVVDLKGCIFDGAPTNVGYSTSSNASVLALNQGTVRMTDCQIRNLPALYGQGISLGGSSANILQIDGLLYSGSGQGALIISGITVGANAVVTSSSALATNPFQVGAYLNFTGVGGMTQVNNAEAIITAIGGSTGAWTATTSLNTTGFGAFTSGGAALMSLPLINLTNTNAGTQFYASGVKGDKLQPFINPQANFNVSIKSSTDWFGPIASLGSSNYVLLPHQSANLWTVGLLANQGGGAGVYRKGRMDNVEKDNDFATSAKSFLVQATAVQGAANTNPALTLVAEFNQPGAGATIASQNAGVVSISWPNSYTNVSIDAQSVVSG